MSRRSPRSVPQTCKEIVRGLAGGQVGNNLETMNALIVVLWSSWLSSSAWADPAAPLAPATVTGGPSTAVSVSFESRLEEAAQIRQSGQNAAAMVLLEALEPDVPDHLRGAWLHQRGICAEVAWDYEAAIVFYDASIAAGGDREQDARYRKALSLEALGRADEAVATIRALSRARGLDDSDTLAVAIQRGTTEIKAGRTWRGSRRLDRALADAEAANLHTWLRAKAHAALAQARFEEAGEVALRGSERKVVKRLKERAALITAGEDQILEIVALNEVEWVLASLLDIGAAYESLGADLAAVKVPRGQDPDAYRAALAPYVSNMTKKAATIYGMGVDLAVRLGWESPRVGKLREERDRLVAGG